MAQSEGMMFATLLISGRGWLLPAAVFLGLGLLLLLWAYRAGRVAGWVRAVCVLLKGLGLLALAACLLEPLWTGQRARPGANFFALLADNSQGMQIKDHGATRSRGESLRSLLALDKPAWQARLEENFQVRRYLFDTRLQATKDFGDLVFDGRGSFMGAALRALADRYQGQPLAGVLLLTDGNATDLPDGLMDTTGLPPVYPVVIGTDDPIKDITISKLTLSQTAFEDAPVSIQADVTANGYSGESLVAQLIEVAQASRLSSPTNTTNSATIPTSKTNVLAMSGTGGTPVLQDKIVAEQTLRAPREGEMAAFRFRVRPAKSGLVYYRLRVAAKGELAQFEDAQVSTEATLANNTRVLVVNRGQGPYRVLYVAGRPNWEYKFLNRALEADDQLELVALLRIARREPKFDFRGRAGETANPLFRGFGNQSPEEIERYDQPVLVRLIRDETELRGGFPKTPEELYAYHAVVVDDLEAQFFTPDQMTLLQKFVSERGGGFLMLGGAECFQQGRYQRTPIGDMLPVYLDLVSEAVPASEWRWSLTREGWLQPWARLRNTESEERARLEAMPPFRVLNRVRGVKPGASVIAHATDPRNHQYPALVVQRFGSGRTAALTIGDVWRWGFREEAMHRDMDKAWRQLFRWLVVDVPERVELQVESKRGDPNQAVTLQARVRDKKFQPLDNVTATVTVRPVGQASHQPERPAGTTPGRPELMRTIGTGETPVLRLNAEPSLNEAGLYEATYVSRETGGYQAEVIVTDATGAEVGRAQAGWTSDPAAEEFRSLKPNRALLETIAKKTGGEVISATKLEEFARRLPERKAPITESWSFPLWHQASVFLFALLCFVVEWGLRRWKGLA